ncbi:DUF6499 domain-containing protein (plasmid) [Rhodopseudomonas sp. BAL398]|nr:MULTISPECIES: DUF6499 domain-containing protein [Rhodopseudomonas]MDF3811239.1 DUF6499 domain-containing protein [Rhodopseudomonas sp. BAL398]WOK19515.1 DUF6499 domain-containing protein [Rhodopseudomonas sp. BAL398]WOK20886.1 DUF6499 domain-containing protein [Rhodopseudomonas sp. BAL398]
MSEDSDWRSEAAYDYIDQLTPSDLAWEFLRRNPEYRSSYAQLVATGQISPEAAAAFARHWGLHFRCRSTRQRPVSTDLLDPTSRSRRNRPRRWATP